MDNSILTLTHAAAQALRALEPMLCKHNLTLAALANGNDPRRHMLIDGPSRRPPKVKSVLSVSRGIWELGMSKDGLAFFSDYCALLRRLSPTQLDLSHESEFHEAFLTLFEESNPISADPLYLERECDQLALARWMTDREFRAMRICGGRQSGKSSLVKRLIPRMLQAGYTVVEFDCSALAAEIGEHGSVGDLLHLIVQRLCEKMDVTPDKALEDAQRTSGELDSFITQVCLLRTGRNACMILDNVDRLVGLPCCDAFFSALRRLTSADQNSHDRFRFIVTHTTDMKQVKPESSLLVLPRVMVGDFTVKDLRTLNDAYGLRAQAEELDVLHRCLGGQPKLSRLVFDLVQGQLALFADVERMADREDGPFQDYFDLSRTILTQASKPAQKAFLELCRGKTRLPSSPLFEELFRIGLVQGTRENDATLRCPLFASWLLRRMNP